MKIAVPTDDGEIISKDFSRSRGFVVATVNDSGIIRREMRWNLLSEMMTSESGYLYNLCDCNAVIVKEIGSCHYKRLETEKKKVVRTKDTLVSMAFSNYLEKIMIPEPATG